MIIPAYIETKKQNIRSFREKRSIFPFYNLPYSPHLIIVEIHWQVKKGKSLKSQDYAYADTFFYSTNRVLAANGYKFEINYVHNVA